LNWILKNNNLTLFSLKKHKSPFDER